MAIRVVVADDQELVRSGFAMILDAQPDIEVVAEAADGAQAVEAVRVHRPDVALLDVRMPTMDGLQAARQICANDEGCRVVMLTTFDIDDYVYGALQAGASGFLLKDVRRDDLVHAVRVVAGGDALLAPTVTRRLIERFARSPQAVGMAANSARPAESAADSAGVSAAAPESASTWSSASTATSATGAASDRTPLGLLTARERETLRLLARGCSNAEIAAQFVVSEHTVKTHVSNVLAKLHLRDRIHAVVFAYESGLVIPGE
jgi:DNA-binding NarL/FixJ family response regulator